MTTKDLPDHTKEVILRYTGGFIGLEELSVRLGYPGPWEHGGNVVFMDNFDTEETDWDIAVTGAGAAVARSSRHKFSGDWSLKFTVPDVAGADATAQRWLSYPGSAKYGLFARLGWDTDLTAFFINLYMGDGTSKYQAWVQYNLNTQVLRLLHPTGPYANIATSLELGEAEVTFYPIFLVVDLDTGKYDKLYFADVEHDLSAYSLYSAGLSDLPYSNIYIGGQRIGTGAFNVYLDAVVLLKDVP